MSWQQRLVVITLKNLTNLLCNIDAQQLQGIPEQGPLIVVTNHTNMLEIPIIYTQLQPRPVTGFVASVRWEKTWSRWLLNTCQAIPVRRGEADISAIRKGLEMLRSGYFVIVMPEGTRRKDGILIRGQPGVVLLALYSNVAILPVAFYGGIDYQDNVREFKKTDFHVAVGQPFRLKAGDGRTNRQVRQEMADEVMCQVAALLPAEQRGFYQDCCDRKLKYLAFT
jgi:1-acyl-sn-glycerol-3-phosphate acyltransferase